MPLMKLSDHSAPDAEAMPHIGRYRPEQPARSRVIQIIERSEEPLPSLVMSLLMFSRAWKYDHFDSQIWGKSNES